MSYQFITQAQLPTAHGVFDIHVFEDTDANALDDVSNELGSVFDKLLTLKYQNQD